MYRNWVLLFFILLLPALTNAQVTDDTIHIPVSDTLPVKDTATFKPIIKRQIKDTISAADTIREEIIDSLVEKPVYDTLSEEEKFHGDFFTGKHIRGIGKEILFYTVILLLLLFAFLNRLVPKYFNDLYRLFFRTTLHQSQIREQMMQTPLPSLLLNFFFIITGGLYINLLFQHYDLIPVDNFWLLFLYCSLGLASIYMIKYMGLKFSGWIFQSKEAADSYIFIVFIINKIIGIFLLPVIVILAFTQGNIYKLGITFSFIGIAALLIYRIILTYAAVRNQVKVSPFHFILYILAFEILPLLIIYKLLLVILEITA